MATTKLILTNEVSKLGGPGDVVEVKAGYARNYLLPRGLATPWTKGAERQLEQMAAASGIPGRFVVAAAMVRHLLSDPMLPAELLPADWPGGQLRDSYNDFATELTGRRDQIQLVEAR